MQRSTRLWLSFVAITCVFLAGCSQEKVLVTYRPEVGATYRYQLDVTSVTVTRIGTADPERTVDQAVLESTETVLESGPDEIRVEVVLSRPGSPDRTFVARFDRAAQLSGVDTVEGLPPDVLGPLAFPEFLPAAAAAPPDRILEPGEKWPIDARPILAGGEEAHFQGSGRLVKVGTAGGEKVASIQSEAELPLVTTSQVGGVIVALEGVETTSASTTRKLSDGSVYSGSSLTKGEFQLTLSGPGGEGTAPVSGTMTVEVRTETTLLS